MTSSVRYGLDRVIPYEQQIEVMASKGFAMWDVVKECERKGSLDSDIKNEVPNNISGFCESHPSIKRIVLANGSTGCALFNKHNLDWWLSGELKPGDNPESVRAFGKFSKKVAGIENARIECICALGVSPAAARFTYTEKRDFWEKYVFAPGLREFEEQQGQH
jgi:hypothetical protein